VRNVGQRGQAVHCGSGIRGVQLSWFFPNQTEVPSNGVGVRQGTNVAGTAILNIGFRRGVDYCDAGVYTCRALLATNTSSQDSQNRSFTLLVGSE
jgi:hypothetical protein